LKKNHLQLSPSPPPEIKEVGTATTCNTWCVFHQLATSLTHYSYRHLKRESLLMNMVPSSWDLFSYVFIIMCMCHTSMVAPTVNCELRFIIWNQCSYAYPFFTQFLFS
jgi:hypothetical protein